MSIFSKKEYLEQIRVRYLEAFKKQKKEILNEFCINCGYNSKYTIRILNTGLEQREAKQRKVGRPCRYNKPEIREFLIKTWKTSNLLCSKRLKAIIPIWIDGYQKTYGRISNEVIELLKEISPATIDRILASIRRRYSKHGLSTTKPGSIIKEFIPIKTDQWNVFRPGFIEADTVAHYGSSVSGTFAYTLDMVDIATGWTFQRANMGKRGRRSFKSYKRHRKHFTI